MQLHKSYIYKLDIAQILSRFAGDEGARVTRIILNKAVFNHFKHRMTFNSRQIAKIEHMTYKDREIKLANKKINELR